MPIAVVQIPRSCAHERGEERRAKEGVPVFTRASRRVSLRYATSTSHSMGAARENQPEYYSSAKTIERTVFSNTGTTTDFENET
jgi:hypothetical protein